MSRPNNVNWIRSVVKPEWITGKNVLDIGSRDWSAQNDKEVLYTPWLKELKPASYVGIDKMQGTNVDIVCDVLEAQQVLEGRQFDLVFFVEVLEHVKDWQTALSVAKACVAPGGYLVVTTRLPGYLLHGFPDDYWRFNSDVLTPALRDMDVLSMFADFEDRGIYYLAQKTADYEPADISGIEAYPLGKAEGL